jgi:hypothetical protein
MNEVQGIDLSKGQGQASGRLEARAPVLRLLVACLVLFAGAVLVTACDMTAASDEELGNGFGPYGIAHLVSDEELGNGFGPYGIAHLVADEPGKGFGPYGIAFMAADEPGNGYGPYGVVHLVAGEQGSAEKLAGFVMDDSIPVPIALRLGFGAPNVTCAELHDDPVFSASSPAEAEQFEYQCEAGGAALAMGGGGTHRQ